VHDLFLFLLRSFTKAICWSSALKQQISHMLGMFMMQIDLSANLLVELPETFGSLRDLKVYFLVFLIRSVYMIKLNFHANFLRDCFFYVYLTFAGEP